MADGCESRPLVGAFRAYGASKPDRGVWASAWRSVPLATCGGRGGSAMGSVAAQTLAVLGIPSLRFMYVRLDGVCAKPLFGGCVRGIGDGDAGVCHWPVVDAEARSSRHAGLRLVFSRRRPPQRKPPARCRLYTGGRRV